jgi:hypothetical protein
MDFMFAHGQVVVQLLCVDSTPRAQKSAGRGPQACDGMGVDSPDALAVVIARPLFLPLPHRGVEPSEMLVPLPFLRVTGRVCLGVAVPVFLPRLPLRVRTPPHPALAPFPADGPDHGRTILLIGAGPPALVGAAARRIARSTGFVAFFPPPAGTSPRFPSPDPARPAALTSGAIKNVGRIDVKPPWQGAPNTGPSCHLRVSRVTSAWVLRCLLSTPPQGL